MTVVFELEAQEFVALNGGPEFTFSPAISFVAKCTTQQEIDILWGKLSKGGNKTSQQCGWLKDKYGVSWQIVPTILSKLISDPVKSEAAMGALIKMKKIEIAKLKKK